MITCKEVARLLTADELSRVGRWRRFQVRLHLWMCKHCSRLEQQLALLRQASRNLSRSAGREQEVKGAESLEARMLRKLSSNLK